MSAKVLCHGKIQNRDSYDTSGVILADTSVSEVSGDE